MEPIVKATIQACILSAISNTIAQLISCHRAGQGYTLDHRPLLNFVAYSLLSCPPNFLWQSWLESAFPGYTSPDDPGTVSSIAQQSMVKQATDAAGPALQQIEEKAGPVLQDLGTKASAVTSALADSDVVKNARRRASEGVDSVMSKAKELEARTGIKQSPLSKAPPRAQTFSTATGETLEKQVDDVQSQVTPSAPTQKKLNLKNTAIKFAMDQTLGAFANNAMFIIGIGFLRGESVDAITAALQRDFLPLLFAGQKLWPLVSIISFTLVPVEKRTVFGGIVGVGWGIFLSLMASTPRGK